MSLIFQFAVLLSLNCRFDLPRTAEIGIDLRHPGPRVSPTLYGLFFEEINHAGDGGLYAEMVRNGSFEDSIAMDGWRNPANLDISKPLNLNNRTALRLVDEFGKGAGGVS